MSYHWLTHFGGAITALSVVAAWSYFFHALAGLRAYLNRPQRKVATGKGLLHTPLPLMLRILYFVCATTTILGNTGLLATNWLYVEPNIRQPNIFKPVYQPDLTPSSKACIFIDKFAPTNYASVHRTDGQSAVCVGGPAASVTLAVFAFSLAHIAELCLLFSLRAAAS